MEAQFWHNKWEKNEIGFHAEEYNSFLTASFGDLNLQKGARVFVPLCGKSLDMRWLMDQGFDVIGAELSELATQQFFEELGIEPTIIEQGSLKSYKSNSIEIFVGNIFELTSDHLGKIDAIYDRAAFVALPDEKRLEYSQHLKAITKNASQLLITFEYDQSQMDGPPFSINKEEVERHYKEDYEVNHLGSFQLEKKFKDKVFATEHAWLLT